MAEKNDNFVWADSRNLPAVSTETLYNYLSRNELFNSAESRGKKHASSCRESYGDKAVGRVKVRREGKICTVQAEVCPEHRVRKSGYIVRIDIEEEEIPCIKACQCIGCIASAGGCKHSLAFLTWLHRRTEEPALTSTKCYWKKGRLSRVGNTIFKAKNFCTRKTNTKKEEDIPDEKCEEFFKKFISRAKEIVSNCQIMCHYSPLPPCKTLSIYILADKFLESGGFMESGVCFSDFLKYCQGHYSDSLIKEIESVTLNQSKSPDWYHIKYGRISGSTLHDLSRCMTPAGSLVEKVLGAKFQPTAAMQRGLDIEADVLASIEDECNMRIKPCGFVLCKEYPLLGSSPDGISVEAVFEVKSPMALKNRSYYVSSGNKVTDKVNCQLQLAMLLSKRQLGYLCLADPEFENNQSFELLRVDFNLKYVLEKVMAAQAFYEKNIFPIICGRK